MKFANVRDLKINSSALLRKLASEDVVITKQGKPVAAMIYLDEDLLDSFIIVHHPTLLREIERDWKLYKQGKLRTCTLEEVRARLLRRKARNKVRRAR